MLETNVFHALGLHMHQPPGNLELLIDADPWEAEQIIRCYERPARYAHRYGDVGHLHIGFSGILLEQLRDPVIVDRYRHLLDIPAMLDAYRETPNIELIGMGHFHPIFPLTPPRDWEDQLRIGRELMADTFGRAPRGFWPPEMAFSMEMIPALVRAGYEYVVVDGVHVHPEDGVIDVFRPYLACHDGVCITVVPRDRDVSNAQESGLDAAWFANEVTHRCRFSPRPHEPRLVTTWSDGENGGWFRQMHEGSGFFGHYLAPYMEHVRGGEYPVRPVSLSAYLAAQPPQAQAHVQTGAWNVGSTSGFDFSQWAGSPGQQRGGAAVNALSQRWWALAARLRTDAAAKPATGAAAASTPTPAATPAATRIDPETQRAAIAAARRQVLLAQTSCYLFWGDDWLPKLDAVLAAGNAELAAIEAALQAPTVAATAPNAIPVAASVAGPATVSDSDAGAPPRSSSSATRARVGRRVGDQAQTDPDGGPRGGTGTRLSRAPGKAAKPARDSARKRR